ADSRSLPTRRSSDLGRPDEGDRSFEEKLQDQLAPLPDDAHRVMADAIAFYYLFPSKVNPDTKLAKVREVISWRLKESPRNVEVRSEEHTSELQSRVD